MGEVLGLVEGGEQQGRTVPVSGDCVQGQLLEGVEGVGQERVVVGQGRSRYRQLGQLIKSEVQVEVQLSVDGVGQQGSGGGRQEGTTYVSSGGLVWQFSVDAVVNVTRRQPEAGFEFGLDLLFKEGDEVVLESYCGVKDHCLLGEVVNSV